MLGKAIVVAILAVVLFPILKLALYDMAWGRFLHTHHPGKCWKVQRPGVGSEDIHILSSGVTFITTNMNMPHEPPLFNDYSSNNGKGSIQMMDMNDPTPVAKPLPFKHGKDFDPDTFRPHGMSVLEDKAKGEHLIYAISHVPKQADRVEKFRFSPKTKELVHIKSFFSDLFRVTNDLAVLAEDKFYISNWLYFPYHSVTMLERSYKLPLGGILFYNGTGFTTVVDRLFVPNGILLSADKKYVYQSMEMAQTVAVYKRESDSDLRLVQEVNVHTAPDNFHLSENGDSLYTGCHPILHQIAGHIADPSHAISTSQVLRLPLKDGLIVEEGITEEFVDQGHLISGSSVAGVYKNRLVVGSVIDSLAICQLPNKGS